MSNQADLVERAARVLPGGVLGSHKHAPGLEFVVKDARGAYLWDTSGKRYFDYLLGSGPMVLGHSHPAVVEAVQKQVPHGSTFMLLNEPVIELSEEHRSGPEQIIEGAAAVHVVQVAAAPFPDDELEPRAAAMTAQDPARQDACRTREEVVLITHEDPALRKGAP